jgi:hypothetical protein
MKKILVSMFAVAALAACTTEQTIVAPQNEAIGFDTFVDNSTRATDITTANIADFGVYGTVTKGGNSALIFNNTEVTKSGDAFVYSPAQYWIAAAQYDFLAFAPYAERQWTYTPTNAQVAKTGTFSFNNETAAADQDVVYAYKTKTTADKLDASNTQAVEFTFKHILSKVAFSFTNTFTDGKTTLNVYNVKINNTAKTGTMAIEAGADDAWEVAGDLVVPFGAQAADAQAALANGAELNLAHHYVIPAQRAYNITFSVDLYQAGVYLATYNHEINSAIDFAKNGNYVLSVKLAPESIDPENELYPIEFAVKEVKDWDDASISLNEFTEVKTADALMTAIAAGENVKLTADINLDEIAQTRAAYDSYGLAIEKDCVIDGNGHKITTSVKRAIAVCKPVNVTLKNFILNAGGERGIQVEAAANVLVEDVVATAKNYALNNTSTGANAKIAINNCDFSGLNVINVWGENAVVNINDTTLRCKDDAAEGYSVVSNNGKNAVVNVNGGEVVITGSKSEDTVAGVVNEEGAQVNFVGTAGNPVVVTAYFAINYADNTRYTFTTFEEALETAVAGETIVMINDLTTDKPLEVTKKVTLDLNGKNISAGTFLYPGNTVEEDSYAFWVKNGGDLTITGEGEISTAACDYSIAVWAQGGKVTINGGKFTNAGEGSDLIYASANGHVVINGGEFVACKKQAGVDGTLEDYSVLNLKGDNTGSSITCYGGRYYMFDPANNKSENPAVSFVAPGYESVVDGDYFKVVKK